MRKALIILLLLGHVFTYSQKPTIQSTVWSLTEVMYHDVINPPAAARFYAYSLLAGYQLADFFDSSITRFIILPRSEWWRDTDAHHNTEPELATLYAILETGKNIIPSGHLLAEKQEQLVQFYRGAISKERIDASIELAKIFAGSVIEYSKYDGYFTLSTQMRYTPLRGDGYWQPTAPEYISAVEPHWRTIRAFFLDSVQQFKPLPPVLFEKSRGTEFFKMMMEVYETSLKLTKEQKLIANFWDCNPFAVQFQGHMSIGLKKISPGGHWLGITGIAAENAKLSFGRTMFIHTIVALTLHDAFASCWDEKYRSNRIRPETAINRYIDEKWRPLLQTPPFPEYSSGHSVISTATSEVLTYFLGDNFHFTDTTEMYIGLPARKFRSFRQAAEEACISRLYGGIHFRDAIENGSEQGKQIAEFIIQKIHR